jgi:hypothetical protein
MNITAKEATLDILMSADKCAIDITTFALDNNISSLSTTAVQFQVIHAFQVPILCLLPLRNIV